MSDAPLTLFVPFGSGYGHPGLTIRSENVAELNALLADLSETGTDEVSKLDELLSGVELIKAAVLLKFPQEEKPARQASTVTHPQAQSTAPDAPSCAHGVMKWKEGVSKAGKNYKGWFCGAPYGQTQCPAQFVR